MGTWGAGLYANDFARDFKPAISAVARLPVEVEELVEILQEHYPEASQTEDHEEYTTFWLVLADQFHKRGITSQDVVKKALHIIDSGMDLEHPCHQEFSKSNLKQREKKLAELRTRLAQPSETKARKTLAKPQPLLMQSGEVLIFPRNPQKGCFNPYFNKPEREQVGWGACCILKSHHVFGYLACYHPLVLAADWDADEAPSFDHLQTESPWELRRPGTCSKTHYKRMQLQSVGIIDISPKQLKAMEKSMRDGRYQAVNDISISNSLSRHTGKPDAILSSLKELMA